MALLILIVQSSYFNFESEIKDVGVENVLHVVTDNPSTNLAAGQLLMEKYPPNLLDFMCCSFHRLDA